MKKRLMVFTLGVFPQLVCAQTDSVLFSHEQLWQLLPNHPMAQLALLQNAETRAIRLQAKGLFDPKLSYQRESKTFDGKNYFDLQKAGLSVATWPGIDFKANYKSTEGIFTNPENNLPQSGLIELGADVSLLRGLLFDNRRAALEQARIFKDANEAERRNLLNQLIGNAYSAYWQWSASFGRYRLLEQSLQNSLNQLALVKSSFLAGNAAAIDTVEALTRVQTRMMDFEKARLDLAKTRFVLSGFLWTTDSLPLLLEPTTKPTNLITHNQAFFTRDSLNLILRDLDQIQPELLALNAELQNIGVMRKLALNNLLPQADLSYRWLSAGNDPLNTQAFDPNSNYMLGLSFDLPLFVRKERAYLSLNRIKQQETEWKLREKRNQLSYKIEAAYEGLVSYRRNSLTGAAGFNNYELLYNTELRKFTIGESTMFVVNARENALLNAGLKWIESLEAFELQRIELLQTGGFLAY